MIVFKWMKVNEKVYKELLELWQTKLYIRNERGKMVIQGQLKKRRGFLKGDSFSPVGFCLRGTDWDDVGGGSRL